MTPLLAIDPGNILSAYVVWDGKVVLDHGKIPNKELRDKFRDFQGPIAIEMIAGYGMTVGQEIFDTCVWIGRYVEAFGEDKTTLVQRRTVKRYLCQTTSAKDSHVIEALRYRFGEKGTKKAPNPVWGYPNLAGDEWQAFALAVTVMDNEK